MCVEGPPTKHDGVTLDPTLGHLPVHTGSKKY